MENQDTKFHEKKSPDSKAINEHFSDIKNVVIHLTCVAILSIGISYYFINDIMFFLESKLLPSGYTLYYFSLIEPFLLRVKASFIVGMVASTPYALLRIGVYLLPVVRERITLLILCFFGCVLFFSGIYFSFVFLIPVIIQMMLKIGGNTPFLLHADSFFRMIFIILFACGVVLEIPLAMFTLIKCNIITTIKLKKFRKIYFVLSFISGAIFTPPDIASQAMIAGLMILLFEITLFLLSICKGIKE